VLQNVKYTLIFKFTMLLQFKTVCILSFCILKFLKVLSDTLMSN